MDRGGLDGGRDLRSLEAGAAPRATSSPSDRREAPNQLTLWIVVVAGILLTWPIVDLAPRAGLDDSWRMGLHMAAQRGLDAGGDLAFTFGPLGFLGQPLLVGWTGWLSLIYTLGVHGTLIGTVYVLCRRSFRTWIAVVAAFAVGALTHVESAETVPLIVFLLAVAYLSARPSRSVAWAAAGGALTALQILIKFNTGVVVGGIVILLVLGQSGRLVRSLGIIAGAFATTFVLLWLATGNRFGDLGRYIADSLSLSSGYASAMGLETSWRSFEYPLALVLVSALVLTLRSIVTPGRRQLLATRVLVLFFLYVEVRHGFVRHDPLHSVPFFFVTALVPLAFRWPDDSARRRAGFVVIAGFLLVPFLAEPMGGLSASRYLDGPERAVSQARLMLSPGTLDEDLREARRDVLTALDIPSGVLRLLRGHTVHVDPTEISAVWAGELQWRPPPVFQSYSAYTPTLDGRNAEFLRTEGPDRILRLRGDRLDGRYQLFESPAYVFAMLCRYTQIHVEGDWQVLRRGPERCGPFRKFGEVRAGEGEAVSVPEAGPNELVVARVRIRRSLARVLASVVFKPTPARINLDGESFRFVEATSEPLVLCVPVAVGYSTSWAGRGCVGEFTVHGVGGIDVTFLAVPVLGADEDGSHAQL